MITKVSNLHSEVRQKLIIFLEKIKNLETVEAVNLLTHSPNSKKMKFSPDNIYVYRLGKFRLFYTVEKNVEDNTVLLLLDIASHDEAYNSWAAQVEG
jgi:mRNA-degrading endonuclease RelE of RelBE toxin-antitoxin system